MYAVQPKVGYVDEIREDAKRQYLRAAYQELHISRRVAKAFESRVAFTFATVLVAFAAYVARGDFVARGTGLVFSICVVGIASALAFWVLARNARLVRMQCSIIVRMEQAMLFHTEGAYITTDQIATLGGHPFPEARIFPEQVSNWGVDDTWQSETVHKVIVVFAGLIAIAALLMDIAARHWG